MKFISDIAGRTRIRGYCVQRVSALARIATLTIVACALAGRRAQAGKIHLTVRKSRLDSIRSEACSI